MSLTWDEVFAFGMRLPDVEAGTSYGQPALKVNGRTFVSRGQEPGASFCLHIDVDTVEMLKETDPDTFYQTPHYVGWPGVLVRYDTPDPDRVRTMIAASRDWNAARPKLRPRKKA